MYVKNIETILSFFRYAIFDLEMSHSRVDHFHSVSFIRLKERFNEWLFPDLFRKDTFFLTVFSSVVTRAHFSRRNREKRCEWDLLAKRT